MAFLQLPGLDVLGRAATESGSGGGNSERTIGSASWWGRQDTGAYSFLSVLIAG